LENIVEKLVAEGKALVGYDQKEVKEEIVSLQASYTEKKTRLLKEMELVKAENHVLKEKLYSLNETPIHVQPMGEVSAMFMEVFFEDTQAIQKLKSELERLEKPYYEKLQFRRQQKELAKKGVQEATEFLKSLQEDVTFMKKEKVR
jgi:bisphosphoglycerate-dependent phosphoglycerate mutase